ncbi:MAG: N-acetyltransferase [Myxococcales bacterium]|nr:N-acetyltransferase [Myxococcales bacterium]
MLIALVDASATGHAVKAAFAHAGRGAQVFVDLPAALTADAATVAVAVAEPEGAIAALLAAGKDVLCEGPVPPRLRGQAAARGRRLVAALPLDELCAGFLEALPPPAPPSDHFVHPTAQISGEVEIGAGTKIWHFSKLLGPVTLGKGCILGQNVVVERGVTLGDNVKIQNNVSVYSGVVLEDDVFCGPSMVFTNVGTPRSAYPRRGQYLETRCKRGASIGANATIVCGNTLGQYCFVGAGAVVTKDVPDYALVYGNPARLKGWACFCGATLPLGTDADGVERCTCGDCGRTYGRQGHQVTMETEPA